MEKEDHADEQKEDVNVKDKDDSTECEGDANIQLASGLYNDWLAGQGLLMLSESEERYHLQMKVEDISGANDNENDQEIGEKNVGNEKGDEDKTKNFQDLM